MSTFVALFTYIAENLLYYLLILLVLFAWDAIDFYLDQSNFRFLRSKIFGFYFVTRAFFAIILMELTILSGLTSVNNKIILSFVTPLIISTLLQNLVVNIGGSTKINVAELFTEFRGRIMFDIKEHYWDKEARTKIQLQKNLYESKISTEKIADLLGFFTTEDEIKKLEAEIEKLSPAEQRREYVKAIFRKGKDLDVIRFLFEEGAKNHKTESGKAN